MSSPCYFILGICLCTTFALALDIENASASVCKNGEYLVWSQERFNVAPVILPVLSPSPPPSANMRRASTGPKNSTVYGSDWATSCEAVSTQVLCPAGQGITLQTGIGLNINSDGACRPCAVGSYALDSVCRYCPPFTYGVNKSSSGSPSCLPCPHIVSANFQNCMQCPPGQRPAINEFGVAKYCLPCQPGTFKVLVDETECRLCPAGKATATTGNIACNICKPGYYSGTGFLTCQSCLPGTFSGWEGASLCSSCPPGTFASGIANVYCDDCPSHANVSSAHGMSVCAPCAPGYYEATANRTCTVCPAANTSIVSTRRIHDKFAVPAFTARVGRSNSSFYTAAVCPRGVCFLVAGVDDATNTLMWSSVNLESAQMFDGSIVLAPAGTRLRGAALARAVAFFVLELGLVENTSFVDNVPLPNRSLHMMRVSIDTTCELQRDIVEIEQVDLSTHSPLCILSDGSVAVFGRGNNSLFGLSCPLHGQWALQEITTHTSPSVILLHPNVSLAQVDAAILTATELCLVSQSTKTLVSIESHDQDINPHSFPRISAFCAGRPDVILPHSLLIWIPRFGAYWELLSTDLGYVLLTAVWPTHLGCLPEEIHGTRLVYNTTGGLSTCSGLVSVFGTVCLQCPLTGPTYLELVPGAIQAQCSKTTSWTVYVFDTGNSYMISDTDDKCNPGYERKVIESYYGNSYYCQTCYPGYYNADGGGPCDICPIGPYSIDYCPKYGHAKVDNCPHGTWVTGSGSLQCRGCAAGYYAACDGLNCRKGGCYQCEKGSFSESRSTMCTTCPFRHISSPFRTSCTLCENGKIATVSTSLLYGCFSCILGTYQTANECRNCEPGTYMPDVGSIGPCVECTKGSFSSSGGASTCFVCSTGSYSSTNAKSSCTKCETGTYASTTGMSQCVLCPAGSYASSIGSSVCVLCPAGSYASSIGSSVCVLCPAGSYASTTNSSICTPCNAGSYADNEGGSLCMPCARRKFSDTTGSRNCTECPVGTYSNNTGSLTCTPCPVGYFSSTIGSASCHVCPMGFSLEGVGAKSCDECKYTDYYKSDAENIIEPLITSTNLLSEIFPASGSTATESNVSSLAIGHVFSENVQGSLFSIDPVLGLCGVYARAGTMSIEFVSIQFALRTIAPVVAPNVLSSHHKGLVGISVSSDTVFAVIRNGAHELVVVYQSMSARCIVDKDSWHLARTIPVWPINTDSGLTLCFDRDESPALSGSYLLLCGASSRRPQKIGSLLTNASSDKLLQIPYLDREEFQNYIWSTHTLCIVSRIIRTSADDSSNEIIRLVDVVGGNYTDVSGQPLERETSFCHGYSTARNLVTNIHLDVQTLVWLPRIREYWSVFSGILVRTSLAPGCLLARQDKRTSLFYTQDARVETCNTSVSFVNVFHTGCIQLCIAPHEELAVLPGRIQRECACQPGFTRHGPDNACQPCPQATFKPLLGNSPCTPCKAGTISYPESKGEDACFDESLLMQYETESMQRNEVPQVLYEKYKQGEWGITTLCSRKIQYDQMMHIHPLHFLETFNRDSFCED